MKTGALVALFLVLALWIASGITVADAREFFLALAVAVGAA